MSAIAKPHITDTFLGVSALSASLRDKNKMYFSVFSVPLCENLFASVREVSVVRGKILQFLFVGKIINANNN